MFLGVLFWPGEAVVYRSILNKLSLIQLMLPAYTLRHSGQPTQSFNWTSWIMGAFRLVAGEPPKGTACSGSRITTSASMMKNLEERGYDKLPSYTWYEYMATLHE